MRVLDGNHLPAGETRLAPLHGHRGAALPRQCLVVYGPDLGHLAERPLHLARNINPRQVATSKRKPELTKPKGYVDGKTARAHVTTARVPEQAKTRP